MTLEKLAQALDFRDNYEAKVAEAANYIRAKIGDHKPIFGITLGSGLGDLADAIQGTTVISYEKIPHFPIPTVQGHEGKMVIGELEGVPVIGLKGRKHYYEVADEPLNNGILQVVFPVHVLANLGVQHYFVTNASGGLNPKYGVGDIMILRSHINTLPNPLLGRHHTFSKRSMDEQVERFQPMNRAYDPQLTELLRLAGAAYPGHVHEGVYLAVTGPTYETEAESVAFRDGLHADAVGMSTTPEVIVARNRGMRVVGMSCITNVIALDGTNATSHPEVTAILESQPVRERLATTVREFFRLYRENVLEQKRTDASVATVQANSIL